MATSRIVKPSLDPEADLRRMLDEGVVEPQNIAATLIGSKCANLRE